MNPNHWIDRSQRFYRFLLRLYPRTYRALYEQEMFQLFTDQLREAFEKQGPAGIFLLWLRTLVDVGKTVAIEHLSDPQAKLGLLEALPDAPLPWKGVFLVMIPGLVFLVSQIVQLTSDKDWYFLVFYRAAYFLILPVLLVWLLTRRFPIWGLIPLGLLYETVRTYAQIIPLSYLPFIGRLIDRISFAFSGDSLIIDGKLLLAVPMCAILISGLVHYFARRGQIPRSVWSWLWFYGLMIILQIGGEVLRSTIFNDGKWMWALSPADLKPYLIQMALSYLYESLSFLLLVLIGLFFANKYGGFSFLLLLGYLLPTVIFGRYGIWNEAIPFYLVSLAVLVYRVVVALIAPLWLVRAASQPGRQRAAAIPVAIAIISQISLNIIAFITATRQNGYQPNPLDHVLNIWSQLVLAAGLGLAVALYLPGFKPAQTAAGPSSASVQS